MNVMKLTLRHHHPKFVKINRCVRVPFNDYLVSVTLKLGLVDSVGHQHKNVCVFVVLCWAKNGR